MLYPKSQKKKKKKNHPKSILHEKNGTCYLCKRFGSVRKHKDLEEHHIFPGSRRAISEANGFKVYLCLDHHRTSPEAVHNNAEHMRIIQKDCQKKWEKEHSRREWMDLMGKNYI